MRQTRRHENIVGGEGCCDLLQMHEINDQKSGKDEQEKAMTDCTCPECIHEERRYMMRFWSVVFFVMGVGLLGIVFLTR